MNIDIFSIIIWLASSSVVTALDMELAVKEISDAPSWTGMNSESIRTEGPKLCAALKQYVSISPEDARNLVAKLGSKTDTKDRISFDGKIYVFNRFYCNVPERADKRDWKFFGGWSGVDVSNNSIHILFPLTKIENGDLELTKVYGGYFGMKYRGLDEFNFLFERFGRRSKN
jgi:hypothetical protein